MASREEIAFQILPQLVKEARQKRVITYGDLAKRVSIRHHRPIPKALGYIRDRICIPRGLPLLTAIVVNRGTGLPGKSFLPEGTEGLSREEYEARFEELRDQVFRYGTWEELLRELNLEPVEPTVQDLEKEALALAEADSRRAPVPESADHQRLKEYLATHPELLGLRLGLEGTIEHLFPSGDRCDLVFETDETSSVVVEVKTEVLRSELVKGVFQAVKYRALVAAQRGKGKPHEAKSFLVAFHIPDEVAQYASSLSVIPLEIDKSAVTPPA